MAEGPVSFSLEKLPSYLKDHAQLLLGIQTEVEYIRDELQQMRAFIRVADATEESNEEYKVWVKQVRDVAYDTEDVLDEFVLQFSHHYGNRSTATLCGIIRSVNNLIARYQMASTMRDIKSRINGIAERHRRYQHQILVPPYASDRWYDPREDVLLQEAELEGIDEPKRQLTQWLVSDDSERKVISVFGMAGLGKTTLVKEVYDEAETKGHFQNHAWVTVSRSFSIKKLMKNMIQQLFKEIMQPVPQDIDSMNSHGLKVKINEFLQQSRYVVVLDDVWSINAWKQIKVALPNNNCGSRVMLTTRKTEVASTSSRESHGHMYSLQPLSDDKSWSLFSKMTFENRCPQHLEEISRSILRKCEGLPLAIVTISGVLARRDIDEWDTINRSLGAKLEDGSEFKSTKKILLLSFDDLPYDLKSCFLYLSIFPEDHLIERRPLIRLWVSKGFVKATEGMILEEVADDYLRELLDRSLIQVAETTSDGRPTMFRIHDLLREIIITKSRDQNFATIAKDSTTQLPEKVRRLSIHHTSPNLRGHKMVSRLRSLLIFGLRDPLAESFLHTLFSGSLRLLTVLDLRGAPLETFTDAIVNFFHLRYLSLRDTNVKIIPSTIQKLQNLETLDLKRAFVRRLPIEILKLQRLRHLLVYRFDIKSYVPFHSKKGFQALPEIGKLRSLQKLCFLEADRSDNSSKISQLGELNQLRRLGIIKLKTEDGRALYSAIERLSNLRALSVTSIEEDEIIDLQFISSPPKFLQRLYLTGGLESLPQWIPSLDCLSKVYLRWSRLKDDPLELLQKLPNLVHLDFLEAYEGYTLHFKSEKFQRIKYLSLDKLEALKSIIVDEGAMPNLEMLTIQRCSQLKKLPSGIECLTNIEALEFFDMPEELISTIDFKGPDRWKVQHIPKVYSMYWRDDTWHPYSLEKLDDGGTSDLPNISARSQRCRGWLYLPMKHGFGFAEADSGRRIRRIRQISKNPGSGFG